MKNKRGQFFIVMAVIVGIILLGATSLFNLSETRDTAVEMFDLKCENYYYETQELNKQCILQGNDFNQEIKSFTQHFLKETEIELIYVYGNQVENETMKCDKNLCQEYDGGLWDRTIVLYSYNTFSFIMKQTKNEEVYYCEKW
jgi:hypothetical protein